MPSPTWSTGTILPAVSLCCITGILFYRLFLHPLASIPGPRAAATSNVWYARNVRDGCMLKLGKQLHKRYGPVVRVGPNEVWFNSKEAFKIIYASGNALEKSDFYLATIFRRPDIKWWPPFSLQHHDVLDLLSERDMARYRLQRRLIGRTYHPSNLHKYGPAIDEVIVRAITKIKSLNGAKLDLKQWMHIIVVECLAAIVLSGPVGYLEDGTDHGAGKQAYLGWRRKSVMGLFRWANIAEMISARLGRAFATIWGLNWLTPKTLKSFFPKVHGKISRRITTALNGKPHHPPKQDLLSDLIELHQTKPEFTEVYLRRMAMTNFGAGHETTTSALTAIFAMIGSHPGVQKRILEETRDHDASRGGSDTATDLTYTNATIREAQRLYPAIGMSLPRTVPESGMHTYNHYFPPGTTVGCNPISLHRNQDIFGEDAEEFRPERWLEADPEQRRSMERYNLTWGGGARTCPGRHLAEMILQRVVPALVKAFEIHAVVPRDEDMPMYFMAMMTGVRVKFVPRDAPATPSSS